MSALKGERALTPIPHARLPTPAPTLARWLIGKTLVRELRGKRLTGRIVETEAYLPDDPASHSFIGERPRNRAMYLRRGHAYVYRIYGMWLCLNVSAGAVGEGAAVLIRALEPLAGLNTMARHRNGAALRDIARGPGRLCQAMAVTMKHDGVDLSAGAGSLWLAEGGRPAGAIGTSVRIGITKAADLPLRFFERGSPFLSGPAALNRG